MEQHYGERPSGGTQPMGTTERKGPQGVESPDKVLEDKSILLDLSGDISDETEQHGALPRDTQPLSGYSTATTSSSVNSHNSGTPERQEDLVKGKSTAARRTQLSRDYWDMVGGGTGFQKRAIVDYANDIDTTKYT